MTSFEGSDGGQTIDLTSIATSVAKKEMQATIDTAFVPEKDASQTTDFSVSRPPTVTVDKAHCSTVDVVSDTNELKRVLNSVWDDAAVGSQPQVTIRGRTTAENNTGDGNPTLIIRERDLVAPAPDESRPPAADYHMLGVLGHGGMGVVFRARQTSIDREVAVKMLKDELNADEAQQRKFLSEAAVTGELDHPNIVPIYDLGRDSSGALFYSMKMVQGTPWSKAIQGNSQAENLEILQKVADAVAFAHAKGVVHRDLKPENVMLGDFGEVLVLDWGLAIATEDHRPTANVSVASNIAGSPAYMSPELALGPLERIGKHSDIYLLGAILFEIVTGRPPHTGKNARVCLQAAARNEIVPTEAWGELVDIARTAMATDPENRYPTVQALQQAIRLYQSHSESIALADRAEQELQAAGESREYQAFARAVFGFTEAYAIWNANEPAKSGISRAMLAYAECALGNSDFDLGLSLLDGDDPAHTDVRQRLYAAKAERDARQQRLKAARRVVIGLAATIFVAVSLASVVITRLKIRADKQAEIALQQKELARKSEQQAVAARLDADKNAQSAAEQRGLALEALGTLVSKVQNQLRDTPATQKLKQDLLGTGLDGLRKVASSAKSSRAADVMMAEAHLRMGDVFQGLGQHAEARQQYELGHEIRKEVARQRVGDRDSQRMLAASFAKLGDINFLEGQGETAEQHYKQSLAIRESLVTSGSPTDEAQIDLATSLVALGKVSEPATARNYYSQALKLRQELAARAGASTRISRERDVWIAYNKLAELSLRLKDVAAAQGYYENALKQAETLAKLVPQSVRAKLDLANGYVSVGNSWLQAGDSAAATTAYGNAVEIFRPLAKDDPQNLELQASMALVLARKGDHSEAALRAEAVRSLAPQNYLNLYNVACCYALCSAAVGRGHPMGQQDSDAQMSRQNYANKAIEALRQAKARGLKGQQTIIDDHDLDAIRGHADYDALLKELE